MSGAEAGKPAVRDEIVTLIGYRGSGKTVVGRLLAQRLGWEFIDTDDLVEQQAGKTIREIFATDGEPAFRRLEAAALDRALAGRRRVIAAGGGAVLSHHCRRALRSTGLCIWLTAPPEELLQRIEADAQSESRRPQLTASSGLEEIRALLEARLPAYEATADHVISTAGRPVERVVEAILDYLMGAPRCGERS